MAGTTSFFIGAAAPHAGYLHGTHAPGLVLLSLFVSIFSSTMALHTAQIARRTEKATYRQIALLTGAIALGGGIWTMHFIGVLAFELPSAINYSTGLTLLSFVPACAASWLALRMLTHDQISRSQLVGSGTLVGAGIGAMHYSGMAALETSLSMQYEPVAFVLSIVLAIALAILALWVRYGLRHTRLGRAPRFYASGAIMGLAIAGMHYTGMTAVRFSGMPSPVDSGWLLNTTYASLGLSSFTITVTLMVAALNSLIRSRELYRQVDESRLRLGAILDTAVDGIITIDGRGLIQSFNPSAQRLFGWSAKEVIGKNIKMLMPEPYQSEHDGYLHNYHSSGVPKIIGKGREVTGLRKDGSLMPMRLAVGRVELPGELLFVGFVTDISDRHALEASLRETAERAEQATATKSNFLANMSHEIRTPMNSIIGFTELLLQSDLTPHQRSHLNTVRQSSRSLLRLINDILDTTKMEKGHLELEQTVVSLRALAMQIESSLRLSARAKGLSLATHYPASMPEHFQGDALRLLQILTNLVGNAIKFTERGAVDVMFSHEQDMVHVQVRDSGIGMTPEQREAIFKPFTQADASISRRFGGTGLGTSIARQLAELMGGHIEVESQFGQGSTFHVWLPLPIAQDATAIQTETVQIQLPPLHILIADDIPQNLELLTLTLQNAGHTVTTASDGAEAARLCNTGDFDVVLMDMHMPGTDGLQATRLIRQHERHNSRPRTPVIALTASAMADDRRAALHAGMDGFAIKPLDVPRLFQEIAQVLDLPIHLDPQASSTNPPPPAVPPLQPAIDWTRGTALWGNESRLAMAIAQFLDTAAATYPLPSMTPGAADWEQAIFSLHGMKGVAGNLALAEVSQLAGHLETLARDGQQAQVLAQLPALTSLLHNVQQALQQRHPTAASPTTVQQDTTPTADAGTPNLPADLLPAMRALLAMLARNELDEEALEQVCGPLEASPHSAHAHALRAAIDNFEFQQAHTVLQQLLARLGSNATPVP